VSGLSYAGAAETLSEKHDGVAERRPLTKAGPLDDSHGDCAGAPNQPTVARAVVMAV